MNLVELPLIGEVNSEYKEVLLDIRKEILQYMDNHVMNELDNFIYPSTNIFRAWFQEDLPLKNIKTIFFVRDFLSPREFHVRKVSKVLSNKKGWGKEEMIKEGVLILPFEYFEPRLKEDSIVKLITHLNLCINAMFIHRITLKNPRKRFPIVLTEDEFDISYTFNNIVKTYRSIFSSPELLSSTNIGQYIDEEIAPSFMPIKLNNIYYLDVHQKRDPQVINNFISQIYHKL